MEKFDVIIIGGGVVGCMTARFLSRYKLNILLIDKEADVGSSTSAANSAIVHAGYDPLPGTLKAEMNVKGNQMWDVLSGELGFEYDRSGDYVVAVGKEELPILDELLEQGRRNGVPGMHIIPADEMRAREPEINPAVSGALWAPTGGICDPFMATIAAAENAVENGVTVMLNTRFLDFRIENDRVTGVQTSRGFFACRWVVNSAGLYSDEVMHLAGVRPEFQITPRRGEYVVLDRASIQVNNVLFPVPTAKSKGILVTATTHGNTIVGPNSICAAHKEDEGVTQEGLAEIWEGARKLFPHLQPSSTIAMFAGLRATGNAPSPNPQVSYGHDFVIEAAEKPRGFINLGGIESPGFTAAPAIAQRVVELMQDHGEKLEEKTGWNPIRAPRPHFRKLPLDEQKKLIHTDPRYGRVVCRCEMVTEGEIVAEIHAPIPALTYDAIKRRTWLGTGRCLGSFDMPRVVEILARETGLPPEQITKRGPGSEFLYRRTKELEVLHDQE